MSNKTKGKFLKAANSVITIAAMFVSIAAPILTLAPQTAMAADSGFISPAAQAADTGGDGNGFEINPINAFSNDSSYASNIDGAGDRHRFSGYNFGLPTNAVINGIEVRLDWWLDSTSGTNSMSVELSWNGGTTWTSAKTQSTETTSDTNNKIVGNSTDTWGRSWSITDLDSSNFRVRVTSNSSSGSRDFYLDWIPVRVNYTQQVTNPTLGQSCGLDVALVLDSSGSIDSTELTQMKNAFKGFVDTLSVTPTQFSVTDFDTTATVRQLFTSDANAVKNTIDNSAIASGGSTNWEDGLIKSQSTFDPRTSVPNLIIFSSDGNPNKYNPNQGPGNGFDQASLNAAISQANIIKGYGTRIITLGIGSDVVPANLQAISSADAYYSVANFGELATTLQGLAIQLCGGTITARKIIDADGDLQTTNDQTWGVGWSFDVATSSQTTDDQGYTRAVPVLNGTYSVSETLQPGYSLVNVSCSGANNNGTSSGNTISGIQVGTNNIVSCVFYNSPLPPTCTDADHDSYAIEGGGCGAVDCDDSNPNIHPDATELCNGVDDDCDAVVDEGFNVGESCTAGIGECKSSGVYVCMQGGLGTECNATPGTPSQEICDNLDNDCDGSVDEDYVSTATTCGVGACYSTGSTSCVAGSVTDSCIAGTPSTELCDIAHVDEDCDGSQNEGCECIEGGTKSCGPETETGECQFGTQTCNINGVWGECVGAVYPLAELCDGLDNDCDGEIDEGVQSTFYQDADSDTYGNGQMPTQACSAPTGYVSNNTDCNDANPSIHPNATEICGNQIDEDCNGSDLQCQSVTINAHKVVCQTEVDLPNWGNGGPNITANTAADYVTNSQGNCWLEAGWDFEWAYATTTNPDDNIIGPAGSGWTTFGPTDNNGETTTTISSLSGDRIWMRELMQEGYIPFSSQTNQEASSNDDSIPSAELYCHQDVLNYDNYDYILNPHLNSTYYCVGFNVPVEQPQETGSITACKYYDTDKDGVYDLGTDTPLSWNIRVWYYPDPQGPGELIHSTTTDPVSGCVTFNDLSYGTYTVHEDQINGWQQTAPSPDISPTIVISSTNDHPEVTFLNYEIPTTGSLTICKYEDKGTIGQYEEGTDTPLAWDMTVIYPTQGTLFTRTNGEIGCVTINGLEFGTHSITEATSTNWVRSYPTSDTQTASINIGNLNPSVYFLNYYQEPTSVCGNGIKEGSEQCDGTAGVGEHQICNQDCTLSDIPYCGDESCNGSETCSTCPGDCGVCTTGGGGGGGGGGPIFLSIFNETNGDITSVTAVVSWFTNILATTRVVYDTVPHYYDFGTAPNYGYAFSTPEDSNKVTFHTVVITGLTPGITYYWRAISHGSGEIWGQELIFTTTALSQPLPPGGETGGTEGGTGAGAETVTTTETVTTPGEGIIQGTGETTGTGGGEVAGAGTSTVGGGEEVQGGTETGFNANNLLAAIGGFFNSGNLRWLLLLVIIILIVLFFLSRKKKKKE